LIDLYFDVFELDKLPINEIPQIYRQLEQKYRITGYDTKAEIIEKMKDISEEESNRLIKFFNELKQQL